MITEVNTAKAFLAEKFGRLELVQPGVYAVPVQTSKGPAFMEVEITPDLGMKSFLLFKNEELTETWYS